jgi:hypothetical protein
LSARNFSPSLRVRNPTEEIILAQLAALLAVMSFVLLFASAALAACLALTARIENIARGTGAWMLG